MASVCDWSITLDSGLWQECSLCSLGRWERPDTAGVPVMPERKERDSGHSTASRTGLTRQHRNATLPLHCGCRLNPVVWTAELPLDCWRWLCGPMQYCFWQTCRECHCERVVWLKCKIDARLGSESDPLWRTSWKQVKWYSVSKAQPYLTLFLCWSG